MDEIKELRPIKSEMIKKDGKSLRSLEWRIYPDSEPGYFLTYNVNEFGRPNYKPLRLKKGRIHTNFVLWKPHSSSGYISNLEGEGPSVDARLKYPTLNKWGVVYWQDPRYVVNMVDDWYTVINFDPTSNVQVNVNDFKGKYKDNTGEVTFIIEVEEW